MLLLDEIQLIFLISNLLLIIVTILLMYKWKLDITSQLNEMFSKITDKYSSDNKSSLSDITDTLNKLTVKWDRLMDNPNDLLSHNELDDSTSSTLNDLLNRYGK